MPGGLFLWSHE